jgi:hypothetical protein
MTPARAATVIPRRDRRAPRRTRRRANGARTSRAMMTIGARLGVARGAPASARARSRRAMTTTTTTHLARVERATTTTTRATTDTDDDKTKSITDAELERNLSKFVKKTATTFAPSSSGEAKKKKNPAYKGSVLYTVFEVQAYLAVIVGGLLAFNVIYPSDEPSIARLMGMWSLWMFTVPSLRARDCDAKEKDALNLLFVAMPLVNVLIPFVWKSFAGVFSADVLLMAVVYAQKGVFAGEADVVGDESSAVEEK